MKVWNTRISPPRKVNANTIGSFPVAGDGLARVPTKTQILHAKRRLFQFIERELERYKSKYYFDPNVRHQLNPSCVLPEEILLEIFKFLEPQTLLSFCQASKRLSFLASCSEIWKYHVTKLIEELNLVQDWYPPPDSNQKNVFLILQKNRGFLLTTKTILGRFELGFARSPFQIGNDKLILESLFHEKLKISCPWKTMTGLQKFQRDLKEIRQSNALKIHYPYNNDKYTVHLCLQFEERGFYRNQHLDFVIELSDTYPYDPPIIHCETKVYHPFIGSDGLIFLEQLAIHHQTYHRTPIPSYLQYEESETLPQQNTQQSQNEDLISSFSDVHRCNIHNTNVYYKDDNSSTDIKVYHRYPNSDFNLTSCNCVFMNYSLENVINCIINLFMDATYFTNYLAF
jgi:hypothetical protein